MFPQFNKDQRSKKRKCIIYQKKDGSSKELNLKVHRKFILFRFFNDKIPESFSPLVPTILKNKDMREVYKCVLYSYLSYKDRTIIDFPPEIKIEYEKFDSDVGKIPFFIVFDSTINSIVVGCRGSSCMDDFITDSLGNGVSYDGGKFHEGVFSTASYIFMNCQKKLIELNEKYNSNVDQEYERSYDSYDYDYSYDYYYSESEEESDDDEEDENQLHIENHVSCHMSHPKHKIVFCHKSISEPKFHSYHEHDKSTQNNIHLNESHDKKHKRSSSANEILQSSNVILDEDLDNEKLDSNEIQHKNHRSSSLKNENSHHHKSNLKSTDENLHIHHKSSLKSTNDNLHHSHHNLKSTNDNLHHSHHNLKSTNDNLHHSHHNLKSTNDNLHHSHHNLKSTNENLHHSRHYLKSNDKSKENSNHNDLKEKENKKRRSSSLEQGTSHDKELELNEQNH